MNNGQRAVIFLIISVFIVSVLGSAIFILADSDSSRADLPDTPDTQTSESDDPLASQFERVQLCNNAPAPANAGSSPSLPDFDLPEGDVALLASIDLKEGSGRTVGEGDCIVAFYHGVLSSDGTRFDGNYEGVTPAKFSLYGVIEGWGEGLQGMQEGGIRQLNIPAAQAYGEQAVGDIPANSDLTFVVELVEIVEI